MKVVKTQTLTVYFSRKEIISILAAHAVKHHPEIKKMSFGDCELGHDDTNAENAGMENYILFEGGH